MHRCLCFDKSKKAIRRKKYAANWRHKVLFIEVCFTVYQLIQQATLFVNSRKSSLSKNLPVRHCAKPPACSLVKLHRYLLSTLH